MLISDDVRCKICEKVFCCGNCRSKHEVKTHRVIIYSGSNSSNNKIGSYYLCPICQKRPFPLTTVIPNEILIHIEEHHLPLQCENCLKIYKTMGDLKHFTKCLKNASNHNCSAQQDGDIVTSPLINSQTGATDNAPNITVNRSSGLSLQFTPQSQPSYSHSVLPSIMTQTISTQTTPTIVSQEEQSIRTPSHNVLMMNCTHLKVKTSKTNYTHFSSDHSVSSIKNVSSLSNNSNSLRRSIVETSFIKKKIIRSTSTPLQLEMTKVTDKCKSYEQTFGGAGSSTAQLSSICVNESDASAGGVSANIHQPPSYNGSDVDGRISDPGCQYHKMAASATRTKMLTPLRHVMSKSIHRALAAQNLAHKPLLEERPGELIEYCGYTKQNNRQIKSPIPQALDLRLSPVVRRSKEEGTGKMNQMMFKTFNQPNQIVLSAQQITTESIVITTRTNPMAVPTNYDGISPQSRDLIKSKYIHDLKPCPSGVQTIKCNTRNNDFNECLEKNGNNIKTPITRIPGATINKKLIKFDESPEIEENYNSNSTGRSRNSSSDSNNDLFFTPNTTPNKGNGGSGDNDNEAKNDLALAIEQEHNNIRNINKQGTTKPFVKYCTHSTAFSYTESFNDNDNCENSDIGDDDVFLEEKDKVEPVEAQNKKFQMMNKFTAAITNTVNAGGLWSSLISTITRFSSVKKGESCEMKNRTFILKSPLHSNTITRSLIQKCASVVAGTLTKSPLGDKIKSNTNAVIKSLKRKRPSITSMEKSSENSSNILSSANSSVSPTLSEVSNISTKRFRIHGRRPIYRLRFET